MRQLGEMQPRDLTTVAWAYASLQHPHGDLMERLAEHLEHHAHELTPFAIAGTAWAYASLGGGPDSLFQALALEARERMATFEFRHVATLLHAFSRLGLYDK